MKTPGHFWCDHCDEPAFGAQCHHCGTAGRWVSAVSPERPAGRTACPSASRRAAVTPERAASLFAQIRERLSLL